MSSFRLTMTLLVVIEGCAAATVLRPITSIGATHRAFLAHRSTPSPETQRWLKLAVAAQDRMETADSLLAFSILAIPTGLVWIIMEWRGLWMIRGPKPSDGRGRTSTSAPP